MIKTTEILLIIIGLSLAALALACIILFFRQQQRLLEQIHPENRLLSPGKVWLQLIPLFGIVYQFIVISRIADSIGRELSSEDESNWLVSAENTTGHRPTYKRGLTCAIISCCTVIRFPIVENLIAIAAVAFWISYWVELRKYYTILKQRAAVALE